MRLDHEVDKYVSESGLGGRICRGVCGFTNVEHQSTLACVRFVAQNRPDWGAKGTP